jgi:ABC-type antimicrobial peptide transport system permease subunit
MRILLRAQRADVTGLTPDIRALVRTLDPDPPVVTTQTLTSHLDPLYVAPRFNTVLLLVFATGALALSSVGLYSVIAFDVASRTREIGVRLALGARAAQIRRLVLGGGLKLAGIGIAVGGIGAALTARLLQSLLFGVGGFDPRVWLAACAIVVGVAALACALPGMRASRVDPQISLNE